MTSTAVTTTIDAVRAGLVLAALGGVAGTSAPLFVLEAGCEGHRVGEHLAAAGHRVLGIDPDPLVLAARRQEGRARYRLADATTHTGSERFDVVLWTRATDVDEQRWAQTVANLATLVDLGGLLVVGDDARPSARYVEQAAGLVSRGTRGPDAAGPGATLHLLERTW